MTDRKTFTDRPSSSHPRRGSGLLEFAVVAFTLFLVVFAAIEFCRMALVYSSIASAARVAVRFATVTGNDGLGNGNTTASVSDICGVVTRYTAGLNTAALTCGGTSGSRIQVSYPDGSTTPGSRVQVTVVYTYDPFFTVLPLAVNLGTTTEGYIMY